MLLALLYLRIFYIAAYSLPAYALLAVLKTEAVKDIFCIRMVLVIKSRTI